MLRTMPSHRTSRHAGKLTFHQYLEFRLGRRGGRRAWFNFFIRPFGARSFSEFWRLWNPVYGYFLTYYAYRPLTRILPRPAAMLLTFVLAGFVLHDLPAWLATRRVLPPGATVAFVLFGVGAVASDRVGMDLGSWPVWTRALVNVAYLIVCIAAMLTLVLWVAR